jgi:uncharacterized linocin/CFP29 family protein
MAASGGGDDGYPVFHHIERIVDGGIIWGPSIEGGLVLSLRGGDFELTVGEDFPSAICLIPPRPSISTCRKVLPSAC